MEKPKLTIFYQYNPWNSSIGGIQTVISNFIKYAPELFEVRMVGTNVDPQAKVGQWIDREFQGTPIKFFPLITVVDDDTRGLIPTTLKFTWVLRKYQFESDFFHFHRIEPTLVTRQWKGEQSLFIHNDVEKQISKRNQDQSILWQKIPWLYFKLEESLIHRFSDIYSCNQQASQFYKDKYPAISSRVLSYRNPVDTSFFAPLLTEEKQRQHQTFCRQHQLSLDRQLLLFAGRLHPQKDPLLLLEAIAHLRTNSKAHLLLVGEGELKADIVNKIQELELESRVSLMGPLSSDELRSLYQISTAFILTSRYEGQPMTVLEALACGIPIISTKSGELPNLITPKTGRLTERTPESIAIAIQQVMDHPSQFSSQDCRAKAETHSAETLITEIYQRMYQQWEIKQKG